MFELRLQDTCAADTTAGQLRGLFKTYDAALAGLDAEHRRLATQLAANGEGCAGLQLCTVIVEVHGATELAWLWSSYRPGAVSFRR